MDARMYPSWTLNNFIAHKIPEQDCTSKYKYVNVDELKFSKTLPLNEMKCYR